MNLHCIFLLFCFFYSICIVECNSNLGETGKFIKSFYSQITATPALDTSDNDYCNWEGVTCLRTTGNSVQSVSIDLSYRNLRVKGKELDLDVDDDYTYLITSFNLSHNPELSADWDDLEELDEMLSLEYLDFSYTGFWGEFPGDFKRLVNLKELRLRGTTFKEQIKEASDWKSMANLKVLDLTNAVFSPGTLPDDWLRNDHFVNLEQLLLGGTSVQGVMDSIGTRFRKNGAFLKSLKLLDISNPSDSVGCEGFNENFGAWVATIDNLVINFTGKRFADCVPDSYLNIPQLMLSLHDSQLAALDPDRCQSSNLCSNTDVSAQSNKNFSSFLNALKNNFDSLKSSWTDSNFCRWQGVQCKVNGGVELDLSDRNLAGIFPSLDEHGKLYFTSIRIGGNPDLYGSLPRAPNSYLPFLKILNASSTSFYGTIPNWSTYSFLEEVSLNDAKLCLGLPEWSRSVFPFLKRVDFSHNRLGGPLTDSWSTLFPSLDYVDFSNNNFCGCLPSSWSNTDFSSFLGDSDVTSSTCQTSNICGNANTQCSSFESNALESTLSFLRAIANSVSGLNWNGDNYCSWEGVYCSDDNVAWKVVLPSHLEGSLPQLPSDCNGAKVTIQEFNAGANSGISGLFPSSWGRLLQLRVLDFSYTSLFGSLPDLWSTLLNLESLDVSYTQTCRGLPQWSADTMPSLRKVDISRTNMKGCLTDSFASFFSKEAFSLNAELVKFCGCLSTVWKQVQTHPSLRQDAFANARSETCSTDNKCGASNLRCPSISQPASSPDQNIQFLVLLRDALKDNGLLNSWVFTVGNEDYCNWYGVTCKDNGFTIDLAGLGISGTLPELFSTSSAVSYPSSLSLISLDLSFNSLTGSLPISWSALESLENLDLSRNYFSGTVPKEWEYMNRLITLNLSSTNLCGTIPEWDAAELACLKSVDLSSNHFGGSLPESWNSFRYSYLSAVDVDNNEEMCRCFTPSWRSVYSLFTSSMSAFGYVQECDSSCTPPPMSECVADTSSSESRDNLALRRFAFQKDIIALLLLLLGLLGW